MAVGNLDDVDKYFRDESKRSASVLRKSLRFLLRAFRGRVAVKRLGFAASNAALRSGLEVRAVTRATRLLKLAARTMATAADIVNVLGLIGLGLDLFTAFVYDPWQRYSSYVSDRVLLALAEGELALNQRTFGVQRVYVTPHDWPVNTAYLKRGDDVLQDMLLAITYMAGRATNGVGGRVDWGQYGSMSLTSDDSVTVDVGGTSRSAPLHVVQDVVDAASEDLTAGIRRDAVGAMSGTLSQPYGGGTSTPVGQLYVLFAFIALAAMSATLVYKAAWHFTLATFVSIVVLVFPATLST